MHQRKLLIMAKCQSGIKHNWTKMLSPLRTFFQPSLSRGKAWVIQFQWLMKRVMFSFLFFKWIDYVLFFFNQQPTRIKIIVIRKGLVEWPLNVTFMNNAKVFGSFPKTLSPPTNHELLVPNCYPHIIIIKEKNINIF